MRILRRVPDAVLWLLEDNADASANLRAQARHAGIATERVIFAPRLPPAGHLARQRLADLFLDTLPYNAHTTAADALWAGLPLLTQRGATFPGRVGASLLSALALPELVTETQEDYETMAVALATDRTRLAALREKLAANRCNQALFDTRGFTAHLESAFATMVERHRAGLAPAHFSVSR
jgi:predicted O-linked N-acetylglucosamine transferase (SPINDLY family)